MKPAHFRVLYNQDSSNLFHVVRDPITPAHVDRMVDEVADGGADVLLINPNAQKVNYPSRVWENYWYDYRPDDRSFFGLPADMDVGARRHGVVQKQRLAQQCDYLERALARCRQRGLAPGVSVRMNDMHDVPWPASHLFSRFYREHPEYYLPDIPSRSWSSRGLDYEHPEVRAHFMALIREVVLDYDVEVLELDFLRFTAYFDRDDADRHCATMTGFLREVRALIEKSGKPVELLCRIAATPAGAYSLGFDVRAWRGCVDGLVIGMFLNTGWELPVDHYRELAGPDMAIYACTDYTAARWDGLPPLPISTDAALLRGFAAGYRALGADGVALFNFFCSREGAEPVDPAFEVLNELRHPITGARRHLVTAGSNQDETDLPVQVPVEVAWHRPHGFQMVLAAAPGQNVSVDVIFDGEAEAQALWLCVNTGSAHHAMAVVEGPCGERKSRVAHFSVAGACLRDGRNDLVLRSDGPSVTVLGVSVQVGYDDC